MAKIKALIVDDECEILDILKARLLTINYAVVTASNGREALEKFSKEKPNVVLLDILMPEIDGLDVLKAIREKDEKIPVFIMTAYMNEARYKQAATYNASGFILKSNDLSAEIEKIRSVVEISEQYRNKT